MRQSPDADKFQLDNITGFQLALGEDSRQHEKLLVETADVLFYHAEGGKAPWPETVKPKPDCVAIPMSVFYQGAYFIQWTATQERWKPALDLMDQHGIDAVVNHLVNDLDIGYLDIFKDHLKHMMDKEDEEGVPENLRISGWQQEGADWAQLLICNHPTSMLFLRWSNLLLTHLGFRPLEGDWPQRCRENLNLVNLPCEDWVTTAAKKHLGLKWGATDYENRRACEFAKGKLLEWRR
jgi:hypothetical protein